MCRFVPVEEAEAFIGGEAATLQGRRESSGQLLPNGSLPKVGHSGAHDGSVAA